MKRPTCPHCGNRMDLYVSNGPARLSCAHDFSPEQTDVDFWAKVGSLPAEDRERVDRNIVANRGEL